MARNEVSWQATKAIRYPEFSVNSSRSSREDIGYGGRGERGYGGHSPGPRGTKRSSDYNSPSASYKSQRMNDDSRTPYSSTGPQIGDRYERRGYPSADDQGAGDSKMRYEALRQGNRPEFTEQAERYGPLRFPSGNERSAYPDKGEMRKINYDEEINYPNKFSQNRDSRSDKDYPFDGFSRKPVSHPEDFPRGASGHADNDESWQSGMFTRRRTVEDNLLNPRDESRKVNVDRQRFNDIPESRRVGIDQIPNDPEYSRFNRRGNDDNFEFQGDRGKIGSFPNIGSDYQSKIKPDFNKGGYNKPDFQPDQFNEGSFPIGGGGQMRNEPEFSRNPSERSFRKFDLHPDQTCSDLSQSRRLGQFVNEPEPDRDDFGPSGRRVIGDGPFMKETEFRGNFNRENNFRDSEFSGQGFLGPPGSRRGGNELFVNEPNFRGGVDNERDNRDLRNVGPPKRGGNLGGSRFNQSEFGGDFNNERDIRNSEFLDRPDIPPADAELSDFRRGNTFQRRGFNDDFPMDRGGGNIFNMQGGNNRYNPTFRNELDFQRGGIDCVADERNFGQNRLSFNEQRNFNRGFGRDDFDRSDFDRQDPRRNDFNQGRNCSEFDRFGQRVNAFREGEVNQPLNFNELANNYYPNRQWLRNDQNRQSEFDRNQGNPRGGLSRGRGDNIGRPKNEQNIGVSASTNKPKPFEPKKKNENVPGIATSKETNVKTNEATKSRKSSESGSSNNGDDDVVFTGNSAQETITVTSDCSEFQKIRNIDGPAGTCVVFLCVASEAPMLTLERSGSRLKKKFVYNNTFNTTTKIWTCSLWFAQHLLATTQHIRKDEARIKALNLAISELRKHYYFIKMQGDYDSGGSMLSIHGTMVTKKPFYSKSLKVATVPDLNVLKKAISDYAESDSVNDLEVTYQITGSPRKQLMNHAKELNLYVRKFGPKPFRYVVFSKKINIWEIVKGLVEKDPKYMKMYQLLPPGEGHLF